MTRWHAFFLVPFYVIDLQSGSIVFSAIHMAHLILSHLVGSKDWFKDTISRWIAEACCWGCSKVSEGKLSTVFLMVAAAAIVLLSIMHLFINRMAWKEEALRKLVSWMQWLRWLEQVTNFFFSLSFDPFNLNSSLTYLVRSKVLV